MKTVKWSSSDNFCKNTGQGCFKVKRAAEEVAAAVSETNYTSLTCGEDDKACEAVKRSAETLSNLVEEFRV